MNTHPGLLALCTIPREAQDCGPCLTYSQTPHFPIFKSCLCCFSLIIPLSPANLPCSNSTHLSVPSQKHFRRTLQFHGKSFFLVALISPPLNFLGFPGGSVVKNPPANTGDSGDMGSIPGSGRSSVEGNGNPLQYSCLEYPMDRGAWRATVHRVTKSHTQLKQFSTHTHTCTVLFFFLCILCSFPEAHHLLEASCSQSPEQVSLAVI